MTAFDAGGKPLVNAHTVSSRHRYWDYRDSYAWNDNTEYRFYHIPDYFKMTACRRNTDKREVNMGQDKLTVGLVYGEIRRA